MLKRPGNVKSLVVQWLDVACRPPRPPSSSAHTRLQPFFISDKAAVRSDAAAELDRLTRYHYRQLFPNLVLLMVKDSQRMPLIRSSDYQSYPLVFSGTRRNPCQAPNQGLTLFKTTTARNVDPVLLSSSSPWSSRSSRETLETAQRTLRDLHGLHGPVGCDISFNNYPRPSFYLMSN